MSNTTKIKIEMTCWDCVNFERTPMGMYYCRRFKRICVYRENPEECIAFMTRQERESFSKENPLATKLAEQATSEMELGGN